MGDVLQYARFAPLLAERGAKVVLQCMPPLKSVLETLAGNVRIVTTDEQLPHFDVHLPLISVPHVLMTTEQSLPAPRSYLSADPVLEAAWAKKLGKRKNSLRVGIAWSGSAAFGLNHRRSIPLQSLLPLFEIEGLDWYSLQMGPAAGQLKQFQAAAKVTDLSDQIKDFADSAAILANLDLLITTDTALVHLAGALGKETWVLLWSERDFRWLMDDERMPWYPSVRPFLQKSAGAWEDVVQRVMAEVARGPRPDII
jgi:hypothetical protein